MDFKVLSETDFQDYSIDEPSEANMPTSENIIIRNNYLLLSNPQLLTNQIVGHITTLLHFSTLRFADICKNAKQPHFNIDAISVKLDTTSQKLQINLHFDNFGNIQLFKNFVGTGYSQYSAGYNTFMEKHGSNLHSKASSNLMYSDVNININFVKGISKGSDTRKSRHYIFYPSYLDYMQDHLVIVSNTAELLRLPQQEQPTTDIQVPNLEAIKIFDSIQQGFNQLLNKANALSGIDQDL